MTHKWTLVGGLLLFLALTGTAQPSRLKSLRKEGLEAYRQGRYPRAQDALLPVFQADPDDPEVRQALGLTYFFTEQYERAVKLLEAVAQPEVETRFYLARALHFLHRFDEAIRAYKDFLRHADEDHPWRARVKDEILRAAFGLARSQEKAPAIVENLGAALNGPGDDFAPIPSPNFPDRLYFSSARPQNIGEAASPDGFPPADLYTTQIQGGGWSAPQPLSPFLNTPQEEQLLDVSDDGSRLYFLRGPTRFSGFIYVDTFRADLTERTLALPEFEGPLRPWEGDVSAFFFNDSILLFSSRRPGGLGGLDLYLSVYSRGEWSEPENLGAPINTPYDETSPFLARDGRTLYFSTNHPRRSMGGFDVLRTVFIDRSEQWTTPRNLYQPINSAGDELHFRLDENGTRAFFASNRAGGFGGLDLYAAYFNAPQKEQEYYSIPLVFSQVPEYKLRLAETGSLEQVATDLEAPASGGLIEVELKPLFYEEDGTVLTPNNIAKLEALAELLLKYPQLKVLLTAHSNHPPEENFGLFYSIKQAEQAAAFLMDKGVPPTALFLKGVGGQYPLARQVLDERPNPIGRRLNRRIDLRVQNTKGLPLLLKQGLPEVSKAMEAREGRFYESMVRGLTFKVEIGALPQMYQGSLLAEYPHPSVERVPGSENYHYTVGLYQTYHSAEELRKDLARKGLEGARVIPYLDGRRLMPDEILSWSREFPDLLNLQQ